MSEETKNDHNRAVNLGKIADIPRARGELDEALRIRKQEQLPVFERLGDVDLMAATFWDLAKIHLQKKEYEPALQRMMASYALFLKLGRAEGLAVVGQTLGAMLCQFEAIEQGIS